MMVSMHIWEKLRKNNMLPTSIVLYNILQSQIDAVIKSIIESSCINILHIIKISTNDKWLILEKDIQIAV